VQDTGIGIDAKHIPRLTERFYRIDRGRSRDAGGTGLGLAIVKHSLNRHQAQLDIKSTPGVGSRFAARFPPLGQLDTSAEKLFRILQAVGAALMLKKQPPISGQEDPDLTSRRSYLQLASCLCLKWILRY
jgi:hypothetical protein